MAKKNVNTFLISRIDTTCFKPWNYQFQALETKVSRRGNKSFTLMKQKFHAGETVVSNEGTTSFSA